MPIFAQEYDDDEDDWDQPSSPPINIDSDWDSYKADLYVKGDKSFIISMGMIIPTVFTGKGMGSGSRNINFGGTGSLSYNYYLSPGFFVGGEVSGMFAGTKGGNMIYIIPFGIRGGCQFIFKRMEFPITVMLGGAPQSYLEENYFGFVAKLGASGFFRYNNDWSFGLNTQWWMLPQWPKNGRDVLGNFLEVTLSARYHF